MATDLQWRHLNRVDTHEQGEVDELDTTHEQLLNGARALGVKVPKEVHEFTNAAMERWQETCEVYRTLLTKKDKHTTAATRCMLLSVLDAMLSMSYPRFVNLQTDLAAQELIEEVCSSA